MTGSWWLKSLATAGVGLILAVHTAVPAAAIEPPIIDPGALLPPGPAAPEPPGNKRNFDCRRSEVRPGTDFKAINPSLAMLNLPEAWRYARGDGQLVAVIDTGVRQHPRLDVRDGGDFVSNESGFEDCDAHGTLVAGLIAAHPSPDDTFSGVAPGAPILAIRQDSELYSSNDSSKIDRNDPPAAGNVRTLARAIRLAADAGARVISISSVACTSVNKPVEQNMLGAAVYYATKEKDALIVAAAGNIQKDCGTQNPLYDPERPRDKRNWAGVQTISSPCWFSEYVLCVGAVGEDGAPARLAGAGGKPGSPMTLAGPWVAVAAPGTNVISLDPNGPGLVNANKAQDGSLDAINGTSYAAPMVSGLAALVRQRFPELTAYQVRRRIIETAHNPARGNDNLVGAGLIDPVAALTKYVDKGDPLPVDALGKPVAPPAQEPPKDLRPMIAGMSFIGGCILLGALVIGIDRLKQRRKGRPA